MDYKQLVIDVFTFKVSSLKLRWFKLLAVFKRKLILSSKNFSNGKDLKKIPIIINNRNRFTYLMQLIQWLEKAGYTNIFIIDNDSTYPPLLEYYSKTPYPVFQLKENVGHLSLWKTGIIKQFESDYYIYTDPDVLPVEECPLDAIEVLMKKLVQYSEVEKIGFGLKIDDLPDHYDQKQTVIDWENRFWKKQVETGLYDAEVDTTFALYRPYTNGYRWVQKAYRTGGIYIARHLPWYENSLNPTEEDKYYKDHVRKGASHWIT
jgi:hypothetical protein